MDGDGSEWCQSHVFYLGSDSPAQAVIRAAYDDYNLYILVERKGDTSDKAYTEIFLHNSSVEELTAGASLYAKVSPKGLEKCTVLTKSGKGNGASGVASSQYGTTASGEKGTVVELAVPLSSLGVKPGDDVMLNALLGASGLNDGFTYADEKRPSSWMKIMLR